MAEPTAQVTAEGSRQADGKRIFTPEDFARFAPRSALDMLRQIPGFIIRGGEEQRGLGQANENVLIDGARFSGKSESVFNQLTRISSDKVERIEIVDGATLDIAGLTGQVANIITRDGGASVSFEWRGVVRSHYANPSYIGGEISLSDKIGNLDYTLALTNENGRGAAGGPTVISDRFGNVTEIRETDLYIDHENPKITGTFKWDAPGDAVGNLNLSYHRGYMDLTDREERERPNGVDRFRFYDAQDRAYDYEIGADYEFPLGPGRLKLIGLERYEHSEYEEQAVFDFADDSPDLGNRYMSETGSGERIARGEYSWGMLGGDFQLSAEAAFNRLDRDARLFELSPTGGFDEIPFPAGTGGVREDRYESILSYSRPLAANLSMQSSLGGEYSQLSQTGLNGEVREFWRPKGSFSLAWVAGNGWDISGSVERQVGQLSFGDFLARVYLDNDNQNAGNAQLVPPQSWDAEVEIKKDLKDWGSSTMRLYASWTQDYIDIIPLPGGVESRGNIDKARLFGLEWNSTFNLDPVGFKGAKLDTNIRIEDSRIEDPLTFEQRPFSGHYDRYVEFALRHDIPGTDWAWGAGVEYNHVQPYYRLSEFGRDYEGPVYSWVFIEHKNVFGTTVNFNIFNPNNGRRILHRVVYDGLRTDAPVLFSEERDQLIGPIFRLRVKGTF